MERPLSRLVLLSFGLLFIIFADFVQSSAPAPHPPPPSNAPSPSQPSKSPAHSPLAPPHHSPSPSKHPNNTRPPPPPPPRSHKLNRKEKIGLLFIGIVIVLQICVVGFLVFKRRQLLKVKSTYETSSSSS